jgi:hypothetical protein
MVRHWYMVVMVLTAMSNGCLPVDSPLMPQARTAGVRTMPMGENYNSVVFYDFETDSIVAVQQLDQWHIAVYSNPTATDSHYVRLNTGLVSSVQHTTFVDTSKPITAEMLSNYPARYDVSSGNHDSLAFGQWWNSPVSVIYVLNIGTDAYGKPLGLRKVIFVAATATTIVLRVAPLSERTWRTITVYKDPQRTWTGINILEDDHRAVCEPPTTTWDVQFTRYTHLFNENNQVLPYAVTGVLINTNRVKVGKLTAVADSVTATTVEQMLFYTQSDIIGYNWKTFDLAQGEFSVHPEKVYIIQTALGTIFRMNFLEFYDTSGRKGFPQFSTLRL